MKLASAVARLESVAVQVAQSLEGFIQVPSTRSNKLIDTDVLSAGFADLLSAGHRRRYTASKNAR